jgi:hypothetical protein
MPRIQLKAFLLVSIIYLLASFVPKAQASTDPQSATASATATVPATTPTTGDTLAPTSPILVRPVDGTVTSDNKVEFTWKRSTDPNGNTILYTLYLNGVATYLGISDLGNSAASNYTAQLEEEHNEIKLRPSIALADGFYTWYVVATDGSGNTARSTMWSFVVDTTPPPLTLIGLDNYNHPVLTEGVNFDIAGPKDVYLVVESEPYVSIQITLTSQSGTIYQLAGITGSGTTFTSYQHLTPGIYTVVIVGIDRAGNTTALPSFTITITQATLTFTPPNLPGQSPRPAILIPYTPLSIPSYTATVSLISSRAYLPYIVYALLAVALLLLLIILWKRSYNIIFLNDRLQPLVNTKVYHSIPTTKSQHSPIFVTSLPPISYLLSPSDHGRLYIPHLSRYSTLTVITRDQTYVLSLSGKSKLYTIVLG